MRAQLIVALDVPYASAIPEIIENLPPEVEWYKVGLELFTAEGPAVIKTVKGYGKKVFLDLKLHDIPRTVARAIKTASNHGADLLTVHACGGRDMLKAAAESARECGENRPRIVAVTVLTSLNETDIKETGVARQLREHIMGLGTLAISSGIDGLVCSPLEASEFRRQIGPAPILVTPGIRLPDGSAGDQKRIATPANAVRDGATFLVVGRPILEAPDMRSAAAEVLRQMSSVS